MAEYHDAQEGFRFAPPDGWIQQARSSYPPGRYDKEMRLVQYRSLTEGKVGVFRVSMVDLPESEPVAAYVAGRPAGPERWRLASGPESVSIAGLPGERVTFSGFWEGGKVEQPVTKEVVAVRRGERVYFLTGIFPVGDKETRETTRKALASVTFEK